jgi:predicted permease
VRWFTDLRQDLRFTVRNLARSPGFALVTALTIALGVGAATTVFSVMNGLLFRRLPVTEPDRLVAVQERRDGNVFTDNGYTAIEYERYRAYSAGVQSVIAELAAYRHANFALRFGNDAIPVSGVRASGNYFRTLGLQPALGAFFTRDDEPSVVLSYRLWQSRFGGDRQIVGSTVYVDSRPYVVAGVAPRGFAGTVVGFANDLWVPLLSRAQASVDSNPMVFPFGRLRDGAELQGAASAVQTVALQIPPNRGTHVVGARLEVMSGMSAEWRAGAARYFGLILGLAVLVLLIAAGNIAGMLLARAVARRREIAIRLAIGAARGRLVRQLLTETVVVFLIGAIGGVLVARFTSRVIASIQLPASSTIEFDFNPDLRVLAFALLTALVTGLVFGLAPALQSARHDLIPALKAGRGSTDAQTTRGRNVFVAAQVAAAVVLLVAAGLFVRALQRGLSIDRGYDPNGVVVAQTNLEPHNYTEARGRAFYAQLVDRVKAVPGVESVGLANIILNGGSAAGSDVAALEPGAETRNSLFNVVDAGYRDALRVPLIAGRWFSSADTRGAKRVAVINQEFARRLWPNQNPLGKQFRMNDDNLEVIGVVRDGKYVFLGESPAVFTYKPFAQFYDSRMTLHVRTRAPAQETLAQIRAVVRDLDANVAVERANTLGVVTGITLLPQRFGAVLIGVFGLLGLLLASLGVYGVLAFQVAQRSREIGIRLALGATVRGVLGLVLRQGARLALIGAVVGIALALAGTRYLRSFLFGVSPLDPLTFLAVPFVLILVALLASYIPARRAARVTPLEVLRAD